MLLAMGVFDCMILCCPTTGCYRMIPVGLKLIYRLLQETEAKKKMLASANRTKLALAAEVKYDSSFALAFITSY